MSALNLLDMPGNVLPCSTRMCRKLWEAYYQQTVSDTRMIPLNPSTFLKNVIEFIKARGNLATHCEFVVSQLSLWHKKNPQTGHFSFTEALLRQMLTFQTFSRFELSLWQKLFAFCVPSLLLVYCGHRSANSLMSQLTPTHSDSDRAVSLSFSESGGVKFSWVWVRVSLVQEKIFASLSLREP